jgi:hypothetical protein
MVDVLWRRSKEDYALHGVSLELMFEVCRSERLSEDDLCMSMLRAFRLIIACITYPFIEFLLQELEEDYDEHFNMCVCRLIV